MFFFSWLHLFFYNKNKTFHIKTLQKKCFLLFSLSLCNLLSILIATSRSLSNFRDMDLVLSLSSACYGCSRKEGPRRITKKRVGNPRNRMDTKQGIFIDWIGNYRKNFLQKMNEYTNTRTAIYIYIYIAVQLQFNN